MVFDRKQYNKEYYLEHREELLAKQKDYHQRYREERASYQRNYAKEHIQMRANYDREYYRQHCEELRTKRKEYCEQNKEKRSAKIKAWFHIPLGPCCGKCGSTQNLERHHPDYSKPLEIITLCRRCHATIHLGLKVEA